MERMQLQKAYETSKQLDRIVFKKELQSASWEEGKVTILKANTSTAQTNLFPVFKMI